MVLVSSIAYSRMSRAEQAADLAHVTVELARIGSAGFTPMPPRTPQHFETGQNSACSNRRPHQRQPVISVDTKKKDLIGDFKNAGREWRPQGQPEQVRVHDFIDDELGKVAPYGVNDVTANVGWVSVGIDHDTAEFAVQSIRHWWFEMGQPMYSRAKRLLIAADCGGSNGYRVRLWRLQLQRLADELGLEVQVCHFPPGTGKWNTIEHRMFCHITNNWRGRPPLSRQVVVNLIGSVTIDQGLRVKAALDAPPKVSSGAGDGR